MPGISQYPTNQPNPAQGQLGPFFFFPINCRKDTDSCPTPNQLLGFLFVFFCLFIFHFFLAFFSFGVKEILLLPGCALIATKICM